MALRTALLFLLVLPPSVLRPQEKDRRRVSAGDYGVELTPAGAVIAFRGETICIGSYFTVYTPAYKGVLVSYREGWKEGRVSVSADGRTVTLEAGSSKGGFTCSASVSPAGVRTSVRVRLAEGADVGPVECAAFQIPRPLVEGGSVAVANAAGAAVDTLPIPAVPRRGAMGRPGGMLTLKTAARNIVLSSPSTPLTPFDARVEQYGSQQGFWAFCSIPVAPGGETVSTFEFAVEPPEPARTAGTIRLAPDAPATAVATKPDPTARERLAADELAAYLERISGRKLERKEIAGAAVPAGVIAVGALARDAGLISAEELLSVARDGYVVRVGGGRAAVCGWRDIGTVYGAYALLQRLGVRFYAPGCEIVPKASDLTLPQGEFRAKPRYEFRKMTQNLKLGHTPGDDLGEPREIGEPGGLVHAAEYLVPYGKYGETNPEYFALQKDGKRLHRDPQARRFDVHLCLSNPDVRRISAERLLALIEKQPNRLFFGVSQGDGFAWCLCENCRKQDAVPGVDMTDRLLDYVNHIAREVAKKHPDKRILTLAYTNATSPPPTRVMPEPNVMVQFCPYPHRTDCQSHFFTCEKNRQGFEDLKGWLSKCPDNMYIFDYPRGYAVYYEPFGSFYAMRRKLDFYAAGGVRGIYYCGVPTTFRDLFVFVQSRLLWDPKAEAEPLIDEFMAAFYGKAAKPMREYFDFLHRQVEERQVHQMCEGRNPGLVTADFSAKALEMFGRAEAAAEGDRAALYRLGEEKFNVLFADLNERNPANGRLADGREAFARRLADFARIGRTLRIGSLIRRDEGNVGDWLEKIARIRTRLKPWYADPLVDRLLADPLKALEEGTKP